MADFSALKAAIQAAIRQNGNNEITGNIMQGILLSMVNTMGDAAINQLVEIVNQLSSRVSELQIAKCNCLTPADTSVKEINLPGFVLSEHIHLTCWMENAPNTAQNVRININNTGAKEFYYNNKLNAAEWEQQYVYIIYSSDIDKYIIFPSPIIEQELGNHSQRLISQKAVTDEFIKKTKCVCASLPDNANKVISVDGFTLENPNAIRLLCWMSYANTASEIPTLNINNTGAKRFYYCDVLATAETPLWDPGMYVDIVYASDIDCYAIYPSLRIEQTLGQNTQKVMSQKAVTDAITDELREVNAKPFAKNLVGGKLILSNGTLWSVASCSYTKPINLSVGDTIIGEVATDQALLYKVITDGSSYQAIVSGDGDDTRPQVFSYTAKENIQVAVSGYTESIKIYGGTYGRLLGEVPLELKLIEGKVILNDGNLWDNSLCSYTKPILLRRGEKIIGTEKCDQAFLFKTDKNGSFYSPLVAGDGAGVETKQFEYTAPYDMYVAFGGYTETLSAKVGLMTYFANTDTNDAESIMGNSVNSISQKAASEIIAHGDAKDDLLFDDTFELPVVPAQNGTDPNGIINLNTAGVQDIYDLWDDLVERSNGYIQKEILGKDQSGTYDIMRFTCVNKYVNVGLYPNYSPVNIPVYKRKVVIDAQVHGRDNDPIDATFMVYWLAKFLVDEYGTNPVATWLRDTYMFIFLPLMNPWGVMNHTYGNSRNVNINWNYPADNFVPNLTIDYGTVTGASPASEKETQYIVQTLLAHKDLFAWMDVHSWATAGYKVFYSVPDDYLHPYNEKRMLQVTQYAMSKVPGGRALWWKDYGGAGGGYIQGWSPYYGAKNLGIWCPHMEMCNKNGGGTAFSSDALTSDFYTLVGQLMFK